MSRGPVKLESIHWEAHLYHLICRVWADRRCKVCGLRDVTKGKLEQWNQPPNTKPLPVAHA
jgi:hypothetical protein